MPTEDSVMHRPLFATVTLALALSMSGCKTLPAAPATLCPQVPAIPAALVNLPPSGTGQQRAEAYSRKVVSLLERLPGSETTR